MWREFKYERAPGYSTGKNQSKSWKTFFLYGASFSRKTVAKTVGAGARHSEKQARQTNFGVFFSKTESRTGKIHSTISMYFFTKNRPVLRISNFKSDFLIF